MKNILLLCLNFLKAGLFSIGGGLATLPFINEMSSNHPEWFTKEDIATMIAVSESTPGPIGINMATFAGVKTGNVFTGILSTLSLVLMPFLILYILTDIIKKKNLKKKWEPIFLSLRAAAVGLIFAAGFSVFLISIFPGFSGDPLNLKLAFQKISLPAMALLILFFICLRSKKGKKIHPILYILAGAIIGILIL